MAANVAAAKWTPPFDERFWGAQKGWLETMSYFRAHAPRMKYESVMGYGGFGLAMRWSVADGAGDRARQVVAKVSLSRRDRNGNWKDNQSSFRRELGFLYLMRGSEHVVQLADLGNDVITRDAYNNPNAPNIIIVLELLERCDLSDLVNRITAAKKTNRNVESRFRKLEYIPNRILWRFFLCLLVGERDITDSEHDFAPVLKLSDFGIAAEYDPDGNDEEKLWAANAGRTVWKAPEQWSKDAILTSNDFGSSTNVWGVGLNMLYLICQSGPRPRHWEPKTASLLLNPDGSPRDAMVYGLPQLFNARMDGYSVAIRNLVSLCLAQNHKERPSLEALLYLVQKELKDIDDRADAAFDKKGGENGKGKDKDVEMKDPDDPFKDCIKAPPEFEHDDLLLKFYNDYFLEPPNKPDAYAEYWDRPIHTRNPLLAQKHPVPREGRSGGTHVAGRDGGLAPGGRDVVTPREQGGAHRVPGRGTGTGGRPTRGLIRRDNRGARPIRRRSGAPSPPDVPGIYPPQAGAAPRNYQPHAYNQPRAHNQPHAYDQPRSYFAPPVYVAPGAGAQPQIPIPPIPVGVGVGLPCPNGFLYGRPGNANMQLPPCVIYQMPNGVTYQTLDGVVHNMPRGSQYITPHGTFIAPW